MTRAVRAILIAGDDVDVAGTPAPGAESALEIVERDLEKRFTSASPVIRRLQNRPTRQQVIDAFMAMQPLLSGSELFVVMFAGHGDTPNPLRPAQAWYLTDGQWFDDRELADQLLALPDGVDIVVVSDCCYGEGFFYRGLKSVMRHASIDRALGLANAAAGVASHSVALTDPEWGLLTAQSQALCDMLCTTFGDRQEDSPMVCISAASKNGQVALVELPNLAQRTVSAADRQDSYAKLKAEFDANKPAGAAFHVDARPTARLRGRVLGV